MSQLFYGAEILGKIDQIWRAMTRTMLRYMCCKQYIKPAYDHSIQEFQEKHFQDLLQLDLNQAVQLQCI
jgi:hypothetical protein